MSVQAESREAAKQNGSIAPRSAQDLAAAITARIDRLPENRRVWWLVIVVALAGLFEVYDLYQTAYVPAGLVRAGIFSSGATGLFGVADQALWRLSPWPCNRQRREF